MSLKNFIFDKIKGLVETNKNDDKSSMTEDEIWKAIDEFVNTQPANSSSRPVLQMNFDEEKDEDVNLVKVRVPGSWSLFKYLGKPEYHGLGAIEKDNRIYFTIPCGWEWDDAVKYWFITFPLNGAPEELVEFFTLQSLLQ